MDNHSNESTQVLGQCGVTQIRRCDCGMLDLAVGPVTLKLTEQAFAQVFRCVSDAYRNLTYPTPDWDNEETKVVALRPRD